MQMVETERDPARGRGGDRVRCCTAPRAPEPPLNKHQPESEKVRAMPSHARGGLLSEVMHYSFIFPGALMSFTCWRVSVQRWVSRVSAILLLLATPQQLPGFTPPDPSITSAAVFTPVIPTCPSEARGSAAGH